MECSIRRIMIVDDDPGARLVLREGLASRGYKSYATRSGRNVLALARRRRPDLILMDIGMPGVDGLEACRAVRDAGLKIPLVLLTAKCFLEDQEKGLEAGADAYLTKPFDIDDVVKTVKIILGE